MMVVREITNSFSTDRSEPLSLIRWSVPVAKSFSVASSSSDRKEQYVDELCIIDCMPKSDDHNNGFLSRTNNKNQQNLQINPLCLYFYKGFAAQAMAPQSLPPAVTIKASSPTGWIHLAHSTWLECPLHFREGAALTTHG